MATCYWNNCCCMCFIHKLLCCQWNNNCIMFSLGTNLRIKWNNLYTKIYLLLIYYPNCLWKCWYRWNLFLGSSNWNCYNRNLQTLIMFWCYYKSDNTHWMCCICSFNSMHNLRNSLYFLVKLLILFSLSWLCLRNRWSLLLDNNNNSCNKYYSCFKLISLQT